MNREASHHDDADRDPAGDRVVADGVDAETGEVVAPFGLPVLAELPELARLLERLVTVDRLLAEVLDTLVLLADSGQVETATGVPVEQWLSIVARRTSTDVRMLRCAVRVCRRLPALYTGFRDGRLSWAQLRVVALKCDRVPQHTDLALDAKVADAIDSCREAEPDALARMVGWAIAELTDPPEQQPAPELGQGYLHLQPRLDGTGGSVFGELDAYSFALVDAATAPRTPPDAGPTRPGFAGPCDPDEATAAAATLGRQRLTNLLGRLADRGTGDAGAPDVNGRDGETGGGQDVRPVAGCKLQLRAELDALLGGSHLPAQLLTTLAGGAMHLDAAAARRLADAGVDVRLIVTDQGRVVGVGRQSRVPPGWLRDATLALHDTCTAPGCDRPALTAHTDHAVPWEAGGHTDVANCGPLCGHDNHTKERAGWRASGQPDGTRHWHHPRTGLRVTTHPATERPPPRPASRQGADRDHDPLASTSRSGRGRARGGREPPRHPPPEGPPDR
jgi:hypothetical protein